MIYSTTTSTHIKDEFVVTDSNIQYGITYPRNTYNFVNNGGNWPLNTERITYFVGASIRSACLTVWARK